MLPHEVRALMRSTEVFAGNSEPQFEPQRMTIRAVWQLILEICNISSA